MLNLIISLFYYLNYEINNKLEFLVKILVVFTTTNLYNNECQNVSTAHMTDESDGRTSEKIKRIRPHIDSFKGRH